MEPLFGAFCEKKRTSKKPIYVSMKAFRKRLVVNNNVIDSVGCDIVCRIILSERKKLQEVHPFQQIRVIRISQ